MQSLTISGLEKRFPGGSVAVGGIDLDLRPGSFTTLLGPSGCGKTTTLRCLAGLEVPDAGRIQFGDDVFVDVAAGRFTAPHKRHLGMVFQSYALWPNKSVLGNVAYPIRLRGGSRTDAETKAKEALRTVGLVGLEQRYPHELSGGQQQRVALARGLVSASGLLLFDEPLSNLDARLRLTMRTEIRRLHDELGYSSVYVTHDQEEALAVSDYVVVLNAGRIEQAGTPHEIFARPASTWVADFVGFDNILPVLEGDADGLTVVGGGGMAVEAGRIAALRGDSIAFRSADVDFAHRARPETVSATFRGRVTSSSYLGDAYRLGVEIAAETTVIATIPDSSRDQTQEKYLGEVHEFAVAAQDVIVLP
ncbi:ABC transporter ATP-binding protein [Microbacterium sp. 18062]|uniref:ABC transporter ATP-binding protein n=1 Tax=Microbacterium sp. 18062 TaxID=2681410 RepID=UPI001357D349|nr:ABC transporter ATP-binding protein [Microbacterium sp. 18062]